MDQACNTRSSTCLIYDLRAYLIICIRPISSRRYSNAPPSCTSTIRRYTRCPPLGRNTMRRCCTSRRRDRPAREGRCRRIVTSLIPVAPARSSTLITFLPSARSGSVRSECGASGAGKGAVSLICWQACAASERNADDLPQLCFDYDK